MHHPGRAVDARILSDDMMKRSGRTATRQGTAAEGGDSEGRNSGVVTAEKVYRRIRETIMEGSLLPGTRLVEEATAQGLGVSRTPVREAIFRLESEGLVSRDERGGAIVAELTSEEIEDIYAVRSALEGLAARMAAGKMSQREFVRLEHTQARLEAAAEAMDAEALASLNFSFHEVILRATHNVTLVGFMEQIHASLRRATQTTMAYPGRAEEAMAEHRDLIRALKQNDSADAERIARQHIDNAFNIRLLLNVRAELE